MSLNVLKIYHYKTIAGNLLKPITLRYEIFGKREKLSEHGVLVCHALTGNSTVTGKNGWWNTIVGSGKALDPEKHSVIVFNIPGNGYTGSDGLLGHYEQLTTEDIAHLFYLGLKQLGASSLHAVIGGSLGGLITWEFAAHYPSFAKHFVPIAADIQSSDWVIATNKIQYDILQSSGDGLSISRKLAMLFYRSPESFEYRFQHSKNEKTGQYNVESYLNHHGEKLKQRFHPYAYKTMLHFLGSCNLLKHGSLETQFKNVSSQLHIVGIDSDILFPAYRCKLVFEQLKHIGINVSYHEMNSIYGHDAFLMDTKTLEPKLKQIFSGETHENS